MKKKLKETQLARNIKNRTVPQKAAQVIFTSALVDVKKFITSCSEIDDIFSAVIPERENDSKSVVTVFSFDTDFEFPDGVIRNAS